MHRVCYYANNTSATVDRLSALIRDNEQASTAIDAMGMTSLHILCCNPRAKHEMIQLLVENDPSVLTCTDVTDSTPFQLFLKCRRLAGDGEHEAMALSLGDLFEIGINGEDLATVLIMNDNQEFVASLRSKDDSTNLFPFMTAATLSECGLDVVYTLAMKNLDVIV